MMQEYKCPKCGHDRFQTALKWKGVRMEVRCRNRKCQHVAPVDGITPEQIAAAKAEKENQSRPRPDREQQFTAQF